MKTDERLSNKEYENPSLEYALNPPDLSGTPGYLTNKHEVSLVTELLPPDYARIVNTKATTMSLSP